MIKIKNKYLSMEQICESGQCFRIHKIENNKFALIAFDKYLEIEQDEDQITFHCTKAEYEEIWFDYFDLGTDYKEFIQSVQEEDTYLLETVKFGKGIRILKQDVWEMIITFIISQQNNIKRIKKCIEVLSQRYGEEKQYNNITYYTFPTAEALANASDEDLRACNLGYRSGYILQTAKSILNKEVDTKLLSSMKYEDARAELMKLKGVGVKVADCICLFGLHQLEAFPVDTHINKVLKVEYPNGFPFIRFQGYEGVMQQYIFYYDLLKGQK